MVWQILFIYPSTPIHTLFMLVYCMSMNCHIYLCNLFLKRKVSLSSLLLHENVLHSGFAQNIKADIQYRVWKMNLKNCWLDFCKVSDSTKQLCDKEKLHLRENRNINANIKHQPMLLRSSSGLLALIKMHSLLPFAAGFSLESVTFTMRWALFPQINK